MKPHSEYRPGAGWRARQGAPGPSDIRYVAGVLAGGRSSRMGRPKALLPLSDGQTIIENVVQVTTRVSPAPEDVVILGKGFALPASLKHLTILPDEHTHAGPLAGLASLLRLAGQRWALLLACDMPRLDVAVLTRLLAWAGRGADAVVYARGNARSFHPCCALYHPRVLPVVTRELVWGRGRLHHVLESISLCTLVEDLLARQQLANVNTPADYQEFCAERST